MRSFERRKAAYQAFVEKQAALLGRTSGLTATFFERRKVAYQAFVEKVQVVRLPARRAVYIIFMRSEIRSPS